MRKLPLATVALLAATFLAPPVRATGAELRVRVEIDPGPFTVGDRVAARLEVSGPAGRFTGEPAFPDWEESWGEAEVLSAGPPEAVREEAAPDAELRYRQSLVLTAFRTGEIRLPPVTVRVPGPDGDSELVTPEGLAFTVGSVLPADLADKPAEAELQPPEAPRPLPWGTRFWITAALLATLCAAAVAWAALRRRQAGQPTSAPLPALPPLDELRRALAAARSESSPRAGHAAVSLALRRYLGRSLEFPAVESSTTEIRRRLARGSLPASAVRRGAAVLADCDLVKFARRPAAADQVTELADAALSVAIEVDGHLAMLAESEAAAAAAAKAA